MADSTPALSSYFTISPRNLVLSGLSAAAASYLLYHGELEESRLLQVVGDVSAAVVTGAGVWHAIASYKLFYGVSRSTFSKVQTLLFPDYFTFMHGISGVAMLVYLSQPKEQHHHAIKLRTACLVISHVTSAINAVVLGPTIQKMSSELIAAESAAGFGEKRATLTADDKEKVAEKCPSYPTKRGRFAILHGLSMLFGFAGYVCNVANVAVSRL